MRRIASRLRARLEKQPRDLAKLRAEVRACLAGHAGAEPGVEGLVKSGYEPLHARYIVAQNAASVFSETVTRFPELRPFASVVGPAEEEYMPRGPRRGAR